jgi:hypothetical protein
MSSSVHHVRNVDATVAERPAAECGRSLRHSADFAALARVEFRSDRTAPAP